MKDSRKIRLFDYEKADLIYIGFIILLAFIIFLPGLRAGRIMLPFPDDIYFDPGISYNTPIIEAFPTGSDVNLEFQPWNDYACERLNNGEMPYWNPYNLCGAPFFANSLNQLTYIPRLIFSLILPSENVLTALALMHFLLCGIGFYYFLKAFDISPIAAGIASFVLMFKFSDPTIMMMPPQALTLAYMPLCLLLGVKIIRGGRWLWVLLLAICMSCVMSSGYPIFFVHMSYLGLALLIWEYFRLRKSEGGIPRGAIPKILTVVILSVLFSLTQLLPLLRLISLSSERSAAGQMGMHFSFHLGVLVFMLFRDGTAPFSFEHPFGNLQNFDNLYIGILPFMLALPLFGQWRRKGYLFFIIAAVIAGIICFSKTPFHTVMRYLPGFGISPVPPLPVFFFCLVTALGFTIDHLCRPYGILSKRRLLPFVLAIIIIILLVNLAPLMKRSTTFYTSEHSLALKCKEYRKNDVGEQADPPRFFDNTNTSFMSANINIYPRIRLVQGYDSLILKHFIDEYAEHFPDRIQRGRRIVGGGYQPMPIDDFLYIEPYEEPWYFSYYGADGIISEPWEVGDWDVYEINGIKLHTVYMEGVVEASYGSRGMGKVIRKGPELLVHENIFSTLTSDYSISETYYPGWVYRFENENVTHLVQMDDKGFMMIPNIQPGDQRVEIFYEPSLERRGFILTIISFVLGGAFVLFMDKRSRLKNPDA